MPGKGSTTRLLEAANKFSSHSFRKVDNSKIYFINMFKNIYLRQVKVDKTFYSNFSDNEPFLCNSAGTELPVGLRTSSRIFRGSPMVFVMSRNFAITYALFGYF